MIIFTPLRDITPAYLEYKGIRQVIKCNLSSYYEATNLDYLLPNPNCISQDVIYGDCTDPLFDMQYHQYILTDPNAFLQFMSIMIPAYNNPDTLVHVMIKQTEFRDVITESLAKLIQQRYGYNVCIVNEQEDFLYSTESDLTIPGLFNMDSDIARWQSMVDIPTEEGESRYESFMG